MATGKKRRRLPEEDLAASVAEILNSPITRANLSFLRPPEFQDPEEHGLKPIGLDPAATGFEPAGLDSRPMGFEAGPPALRPLWQAEGLGALFEESRVRRIERAQDALSLVEEKVYDLLWGPRNLKKDDYRLVHFSLQRIAAEARINIKTVRELIPRLAEKGFIAIEREADPRRNIPTLYRVWSYSSVLAGQRRRNRGAIVKTGKGVFYVHPVNAALEFIPTPMGEESKPMGIDRSPTGSGSPGPLGSGGPEPRGAGGPLSIDISSDNAEDRTTTTSVLPALISTIQQAFSCQPDHALLESMIAACHARARESAGSPATADELLYFAQVKCRVLARAPNIRNHLAVLRRALPECFSGEAFRLYREAAAGRLRQREGEAERLTGEAAAAEQTLAARAEISERHRTGRGYDLEAIAADPEMDEVGRRAALERSRRLGRFAPSGL